MKSFFLSILVSIQAKIQFPPGRIVGGYEVMPMFKYPWVASLQYNGKHACGGAWYSGNAIISAAHCVIGEDSRWTALVHRHNLQQSTRIENGLALRVITRISHPKYDAESNGYDVSVWKVMAKSSKPIIELDTGKFASAEDTLLTVIGWGAIAPSSSASTKLLEVKVPVISDKVCKKSYKGLDSKSQFCAGYPEGQRDACQGDSGGPIFVSSANSYTLVGVVSWGKGCAEKDHPGVYTLISAVSDFIAKNI